MYITPFYPPSIGGVEAIVKSTAEELAKRGYEVFIITTNLNNKLQKIVEEGIYHEGPLTVFRLKASQLKIGYACIMNDLKKVLYKIKPDVVHCHNLHPHLFQAISWKSETGYGVVAQLHNPVAAGVEHPLAKILLKPTLHYFRLRAKYIDAVIVHTDAEFKWLKCIGVTGSKIFKVRFPSIPLKLIETYYHEKQRDNVILYVGRVSERKGLHVLLKAASLIKNNLDSKFIIVGPRDEQYFRRLKLLREELKLKNNVLFLNPLSEKDKYALISRSLLFVHPALKDYTPMTLIEAQALGTPVVASRVGGIPELIKDGITGLLIRPNSSTDLAKAIEKITMNRELWTKMSLEAKKWIMNNFLLEKAVDALEAIYRQIVT